MLTMAKEIKKYHILFYGSPAGYQTNRAQIALYDGNNKVIAYLSFTIQACYSKTIRRRVV